VETKDKAAAKIKSNEPNALKFFADLAAGGTAGGLSKTVVAPIERVKLLLQTQDSNPRIKSGEIARYTGNPSPMLGGGKEDGVILWLQSGCQMETAMGRRGLRVCLGPSLNPGGSAYWMRSGEVALTQKTQRQPMYSD